MAFDDDFGARRHLHIHRQRTRQFDGRTAQAAGDVHLVRTERAGLHHRSQEQGRIDTERDRDFQWLALLLGVGEIQREGRVGQQDAETPAAPAVTLIHHAMDAHAAHAADRVARQHHAAGEEGRSILLVVRHQGQQRSDVGRLPMHDLLHRHLVCSNRRNARRRFRHVGFDQVRLVRAEGARGEAAARQEVADDAHAGEAGDLLEEHRLPAVLCLLQDRGDFMPRRDGFLQPQEIGAEAVEE